MSEADGSVSISIKGIVQGQTRTEYEQFVKAVKGYWNTSLSGADGKTYTLSVDLSYSLFCGDMSLKMVGGLAYYRSNAHQGARNTEIIGQPR